MSEHDDDVSKAVLFLTGTAIMIGNKRVQSYDLTSVEELECRAAIARLLLSNRMPPGVLKIMAMQYAPDSDRSDQRKVVLTYRTVGRRRDSINDSEIVVQILKKLRKTGLSVENAKAEVADERGAPFDTIDKAWRRSKDIRRRLANAYPPTKR